jgi:MoaA/NifB/PqqE/SkfB family radical SAM enzyme
MKLKYPWQLYHWHFEVSGKCALKCPRCPRNDIAPAPWMNKELTLDFFKSVLSPDLLRNTVKRITMCGDIGDPIYASQYLEIVEYIKIHNPKIHVYTITNGSFRKSEWWHRFAAISNEYDTINFSVDGYDQESNNIYRIGSNWDSIMQGMDIMCKKSSAFVYWATIVFSFNQDHLNQIYKQAKEIGCDGVQLTYSTKFGSKYGTAYGGDDDPLEPRAEFISKTHRYERHFKNISGREQRNKEYLQHNLDLFNQISSEYDKVITPMCAIGNRGLYVSADGVIHPCSWVSYPYVSLHTDRKTINFKDSFHQIFRDQLNLNCRSLEDILNDDIWSHLFNSFNHIPKAWVECEQKCNCQLVNKEYAVGFLTN